MAEKILFVTVGESMPPIYEGFKRVKDISAVYYLVSDKTREYAENSVKKFSDIYKSNIIEIDPMNLDMAINKLIDVQKTLRAEFVYNLSGATKVMILACYIVACFKGHSAFYIFKRNDGNMEYVDVPILRFDLKNIINKDKREYEILKELKNKPLTITDLANIMKLKKSTISGHIDNLEKFIEREPIDNDKRSSKLKLTKTGEITLSIVESESGRNG